MTYISLELRRQVIERAGNCCEYCRLSQEDNTFSFQIDHVIAEKHEGETAFNNLSLSCPNCNNFKGSDIGSIDRETGRLTPLCNPRNRGCSILEKEQGVGIIIDNRFEIDEQLGEGGMGRVFRGRELATERLVAIKQLKREALQQNPQVVERFRREALALHHLNHPNMVHVLDAIFQDEDYYIIMEFIDGGSLADLLDKQKKLPILDAVNIALDISDALARAHRMGIVHRDVKPDNVLLSSQGVPYLTDFGQAHIASAPGLTRPGQVIGTMHYMPPEILLGEPVDRRSDIWSFGVMLYEMLSGFHPFMGENNAQLINAILRFPVPNLDKLRPDCPPRLVEIINRMLEKRREDRVFTIREVSLQLEYALYELDGGG